MLKKRLLVIIAIALIISSIAIFHNDIKVALTINAIENIGDVTLESEEHLNRINNLYNRLPEKYKNKIYNYNKFKNASSSFTNLLNVYNKIESLSKTGPCNPNYTIIETWTHYNNLSAADKAKITNYYKLEELINNYCHVSRCPNKKYPSADFCEMHQCKYPLCDALVISTISGACEEHTCKICFRRRQGVGPYCIFHDHYDY